jgi:hypothetical protein
MPADELEESFRFSANKGSGSPAQARPLVQEQTPGLLGQNRQRQEGGLGCPSGAPGPLYLDGELESGISGEGREVAALGCGQGRRLKWIGFAPDQTPERFLKIV